MADTTEQQILGFNPEIQDLSRQRKIAEMLMASGMQQPQGQMISGYYVPPSWSQQINPIVNAAIGSASSNALDEKQMKLAEALRSKRNEVQQQIMERIDAGDTKGALAIASKNAEYGGKEFVAPLMGNVIPKAQESKVVGNYLIGPDGKVMFKAPKEYAPHAPQLVQTATGFVSYNPNTGSVTPIQAPAGAGGAGGALMPPLPQHLQTEIASINQQKSSINDALKTVEANKDAFGPKFAAPGIIAGEYGTSRMNAKMPSEQVEARAKVFNIASSVIKERAGTAQSKQEQETIMRFLPSPYDGSKAIIDKFNSFNDYLTSKEKGMIPVQGAVPAYRPGTSTPATPATPSNTSAPVLKYNPQTGEWS